MLTLIRISEVVARTGRKRQSLYSEMKAGRFPRPIKLNSHNVAWLESEVDDWVKRERERSENHGRADL
jgi:prophage regulatory protein